MEEAKREAAVVASTAAAAGVEAAVVAASAGVDAAVLQTAGLREEAALTKEGQRSINLLWETTQRLLAQPTVYAFLIGNLFVVIVFSLVMLIYWVRISTEPTALALLVAIITGALGNLSAMCALVIATYFQRTNHKTIGGVGPLDTGR